MNDMCSITQQVFLLILYLCFEIWSNSYAFIHFSTSSDLMFVLNIFLPRRRLNFSQFVRGVVGGFMCCTENKTSQAGLSAHYESISFRLSDREIAFYSYFLMFSSRTFSLALTIVLIFLRLLFMPQCALGALSAHACVIFCICMATLARAQTLVDVSSCVSVSAWEWVLNHIWP